MENVHSLGERLLEMRSELGKTRKSPPCALWSLAELQEAKKEPKGAAEKNSTCSTLPVAKNDVKRADATREILRDRTSCA